MALDLTDKTSNGNTLTNHNGVTDVTSPLPGIAGTTDAAGFASASFQYLTAADNAAWKPTPNITLEAWVYFNSLPAALNYPAIVSNISTTNNYGWYFFIDGDNGHIRFYAATSLGSINAQSTITPTTLSWHHYAVTFNGSNALFYLDGSIHDTIPASLTLGYETGQNPAVGAVFFGAVGRYANAYMDELRIWNTIRTDTEISNNYTARLSGSETGLAGHYPFEAVSGLTKNVFMTTNSRFFGF